MAVTQTAYNIIKKAIIIRIGRGEDINNIIESYPKLADGQIEQLLIELQQEVIEK